VTIEWPEVGDSVLKSRNLHSLLGCLAVFAVALTAFRTQTSTAGTDHAIGAAAPQPPLAANGNYNWEVTTQSSSDDCTHGCETQTMDMKFTAQLPLRLARFPREPDGSGLMQFEDDGSSSYVGTVAGHGHVDADPTIPDDDPTHGCTGNQTWNVSASNLQTDSDYPAGLEVAVDKNAYTNSPVPDVLFRALHTGTTTNTESGCNDSSLNRTTTDDYTAFFEPGLSDFNVTDPPATSSGASTGHMSSSTARSHVRRTPRA
jgi:hypothetical protein